MGAHGANLLARAAGFQIHQQLVPGIVKLRAEGLQLRGLLGKFGRAGLQRIAGRKEAAKIEMLVIARGRQTPRFGGGLPHLIAIGDDGAGGRQTRFEVGLLVRPVPFGFLDRTGHGGQIEVVDRAIIALHLLHFPRQVLLEINPVRGLFRNGGNIRQRRSAQPPFLGEQRFHLLPVLTAVPLLEFRQLVEPGRGRTKHARVLREPAVILPAGGNRLEQRRLRLDIARHFVPRRAQLLLRRRHRRSLGGDLSAQLPG